MTATVATPADNDTERTMAVFELGMLAERTLTTRRTHLRKIARRAARIELLPEPQRTLAAARLAAQATR